MDKKTLIRLAQPAATTLLALSIISIPLIVKASTYLEGGNLLPIKIQQSIFQKSFRERCKEFHARYLSWLYVFQMAKNKRFG